MIDNLDLILPFLKFNSEDDFYFLQIIQRRKECGDLTKNTRVIKNYYIRNIDYLLKRYDTIKDICNYFNARAMIRLNKRSFKKVAFRTLQNITAQMMQDDFMSARQAFDKACGQCHNDKEKKWILDIDDVNNNDQMIINNISERLRIVRPMGDKILEVIPSKTGYHIISKPFDIQEYKKITPQLTHFDIHKDNPTNLYIP